MNVFAIGDVHGHLDRLEALLTRAGIIGRCPDCKDSDQNLCNRCHGDGTARIDHDTVVVQVGDLGNMGSDNRTGDELCYYYAYKHNWIDIVLWGNHDRYVVDDGHAFRGCEPPTHATKLMIDGLLNQNRYRLAYEAHGFLLTHAGLHSAFRYNDVDDKLKCDPAAFADWINEAIDPEIGDKNQMGVRDAIGICRGGSSKYGGILWRDIGEKLYPEFRQVFGHSANPDHAVRYCWKRSHVGMDRDGATMMYEHNGPPSYCIDVGGKTGFNLAGIWLPSEEIVTI